MVGGEEGRVCGEGEGRKGECVNGVEGEEGRVCEWCGRGGKESV